MNRVPPGYADPAREADIGLGPSAAFLATLGVTLPLTLYEVGIATPRAYASSGAKWPLLLASLLGITLGVVAARRLSRHVAPTCAGLALLSMLSSLSGVGFTLAFTRGDWAVALGSTMPLTVGALTGLTAYSALRAFAPSFVALDGALYLLNPFRALLVGTGTVALLVAFPWLGIVRRAALLGAVLAGLALLSPLIASWFALPGALRRRERFLVRACPFVALLVLAGAERVVPLRDIQQRAGDVLAVVESEREHHAFLRLQQGLLVFSGDLLALTSNDAPRFAEALVHPVLAFARERAHVLVVDDGAGAVAREVLRWPGVRALRLVPHDPALVRAARQSHWLRELGAAALDDPRVAIDEREASVFISRASARYDVIIANFRDPTSHLDGKYYTVGLLRLLAERLAPSGALALQLTSPERTPRAHAIIVQTLASAGFCARTYRAPLATLGEWAFALAVRASDEKNCSRLGDTAAYSPIPDGTALVTQQTLAGFFAPLPVGAARSAAPSRLFDQPVVDSYQSEEHAFSE